MTRQLCSGALAGALLLATSAFAQVRNVNVAEMTLEELLQVEVTSVSKREEALFRAASAVAVITAEDIRRGGYDQHS